MSLDKFVPLTVLDLGNDLDVGTVLAEDIPDVLDVLATANEALQSQKSALELLTETCSKSR